MLAMAVANTKSKKVTLIKMLQGWSYFHTLSGCFQTFCFHHKWLISHCERALSGNMASCLSPNTHTHTLSPNFTHILWDQTA